MQNHLDHPIYSPANHILLGEVLLTEGGDVALRVKKPGSNVFEVIPIGQLLRLIYTARGSVS